MDVAAKFESADLYFVYSERVPEIVTWSTISFEVLTSLKKIKTTIFRRTSSLLHRNPM